MKTVNNCPAVRQAAKASLAAKDALTAARLAESPASVMAACEEAVKQAREAVVSVGALAACVLDLYEMVPKAARDEWHREAEGATA